jgi:hypothetical protein
MAYGPGSDQYNFIETTLAARNLTETPWCIFLGHRPMYFVEDSKAGGSYDADFGAVEPLLMKYQVDLACWGHVHNAYASAPVYNQTRVAPSAPGAYDAPIHVSIGNAGQGLTAINASHPPPWAVWQMSECVLA